VIRVSGRVLRSAPPFLVFRNSRESPAWAFTLNISFWLIGAGRSMNANRCVRPCLRTIFVGLRQSARASGPPPDRVTPMW